MFRRLSLFIAACILLTSCEKAEEALVLPPPTGVSHATVSLGPNYEKQIFFDFETGQEVYTSSPFSWDLAFEASEDGKHIFINGVNELFVFNTHQQDMAINRVPDSVTSSFLDWQYDQPCLIPDSTGIGEWYGVAGETKAEVYIVRTGTTRYRKMRILGSTSAGYTIEWAELESSGPPRIVQLEKDSAFNYIYFSFENGLVKPEPPKATWDVVFTRYRSLIFENSRGVNVPYVVTGVLLNPSDTRAAADSITSFENISLEHALSLKTSAYRDVIGYDWKSIDQWNTGGHYTVNRSKCYVLQSRKDQLYKLRFLDYYNSSGEKGSPLFEYQRLR